ncbi:MAG: DUF6503 family protein [Bacteroidota bacterium]
MLRYTLFGLIAWCLFACQPTETKQASTAAEETNTAAAISDQPERTETTPAFVEQLEQAHAKADFRTHAAIQFDLELLFGGKKRFEGTVTLSTDSGKGLLTEKSGRQLFYLKDSIYYAPDDERKPSSLRFTAYTWSYFFLLPYKLSDPGTQWQDYANKTLNGEGYLAEKLSFASGTGDAPDDWYIVYADTENQLIEVAAYIVTARQSQAEAEEDPHAIQYGDYRAIGGIPIAHQWTFWGWRTAEGLTDKLGSATLSNVRFLKNVEDLFTPPPGFIAG